MSSAHPVVTAAGLEVLERGGHVVDAAIATSFALGVEEPDTGGLDGSGVMMIHLVGEDEPVCIEFLTGVPAAWTEDRDPNGGSTDAVPATTLVQKLLDGPECRWNNLSAAITGAFVIGDQRGPAGRFSSRCAVSRSSGCRRVA